MGRKRATETLTRKTNHKSTAGPYLQNCREPCSSGIEHAKKPKTDVDLSQDLAALLVRESKKATTYQRTKAAEWVNGSVGMAARLGSYCSGGSWERGRESKDGGGILGGATQMQIYFTLQFRTGQIHAGMSPARWIRPPWRSSSMDPPADALKRGRRHRH
jgi:hypothetical protein